ncbi:MAG: glycosyltransferase [Firmicutes bacterium]|nr:glycosyltransferase [Candidatus Colivicinus equi]
MKRVLFFICTLDDGGAQRVVSILSSNMAERGFDVEILKYYKSENIYPLSNKVKVTTVEENTKTRNIIKNIKWMKHYFKSNADVIVSFLAKYNMMALLANKGNNIPIIVADRNDPRYVPNGKALRLLRNLLYKTADNVIVQSTDNYNYFSNIINRCEVIMNPFSNKDMVGVALNANKEKTIVSVGRLEKQKNQELLIRAFKKINIPDYKLIIYGEGSYRERLERLINELELEGHVLLPGSRKNILELIKTSKLFVMSSNYEGMANALAEAMCIGLPVISTKISAASDLIEDDKNGILVCIGNEEQLVNAMLKIINNNDYGKMLAENATKIYEKLSADVITDKWIEIIESI